MKRLLVYMKGKYRTAVLAVLLLLLQAGCELMLPECTADIIDIGIGQSGIEDVLAESISKDGMEHLLLLMTDEEKAAVLAGYTPDGEVYTRNGLDADVHEELLAVMTAPMVAVYALSTDGADYKEVLGDDLYVPRGLDAFGILAMLPDDTRMELTEATRERIRSVPLSLIKQAAVNFVREDMAGQGIDVDALQVRYLASKGLHMVLAALGAVISAVLAAYFSARLAAGYAKELSLAVFDKVLAFDGGGFIQFSASSLVSRTTEDVRKIQMFFMVLFRMALYAPVLGIGAARKTIRIDQRIGTVVVWAIVLILALVFLIIAVTLPKLKKSHVLAERFGKTAREMLLGMAVIRAFGAEEREKGRFREANYSLMQVNLAVNRIMAILMPVMLLILNAAALLIVWRSASGINNGVLGAGDLAACIQYTIMVANAFLTLSMLAVGLPDGAVAARRVSEVLAFEKPQSSGQVQKPHMEEVPQDCMAASEKETHRCPAVEFKNVEFSYPGTTQPALCNISFAAHYGETTAVIGATGSGKTTLVRLIAGMFEPSGGMILIDGKGYKDYGKEELHEKIGYVPQEAVLFSGTVSSNLRFRKEDASDEELWKAVETAQASGFLEKTGKGLEAGIAQGGKNLSGGQRQRLTIARALVGHPQIYLFDDCFSALDPETDTRLQNALADYTSASASIIVAQDIAAVRNAENILVLEQGRIVGRGRHEELMESCDTYRQIAYSQEIDG